MGIQMPGKEQKNLWAYLKGKKWKRVIIEVDKLIADDHKTNLKYKNGWLRHHKFGNCIK